MCAKVAAEVWSCHRAGLRTLLRYCGDAACFEIPAARVGEIPPEGVAEFFGATASGGTGEGTRGVWRNLDEGVGRPLEKIRAAITYDINEAEGERRGRKR